MNRELSYLKRHLNKNASARDKATFKLYLDGDIPLEKCFKRFCNHNGMDESKISLITFKDWLDSIGWAKESA